MDVDDPDEMDVNQLAAKLSAHNAEVVSTGERMRNSHEAHAALCSARAAGMRRWWAQHRHAMKQDGACCCRRRCPLW